MSSEDAAQTTVVIPVWDGYVGAPLYDALRSVLEQGTSLRAVVVDNASSVALPELAGCEVLRSPTRLSLGAARNLGLDAARTPYVMFWDADDVMLPGTLGFLEAAIAADARLVAYGAGIVEAPSGARHRWPRRWIAGLCRRPRLLALLNCVWSLYPTTGATLMRTEAVVGCGGYFDADSGDDWCLGVSLAFRGRLGWSERPGRIYRRHPSSIWALYGSPRHQLRHAAAVRERLRADAAVPGWVRAALPAIALAQHAAITAHAGIAWLRSVG